MKVLFGINEQYLTYFLKIIHFSQDVFDEFGLTWV